MATKRKMIKKQDLTNEQKQFIRDNRLNLSINDMRASTGLSYHDIRNFMIANDLQVPKKEVQRIRLEKQGYQTEVLPMSAYKEKHFNHPFWVKDAWNHHLNPITMQPS